MDEDGNNLLLDSTYLLPIFGIGLELRDFESVFTRLPEDYVVNYNPVSLIETKWAIIKRSRRLKDADREKTFKNYWEGLLSLQRDSTLKSTTLTNEEIEESSDLLLIRYHIQDYFDRQIYSTAAYLKCTLLTEDQTLHELFEEEAKATSAAINIARPSRVIKWRDLQLQ